MSRPMDDVDAYKRSYAAATAAYQAAYDAAYAAAQAAGAYDLAYAAACAVYAALGFDPRDQPNGPDTGSRQATFHALSQELQNACNSSRAAAAAAVTDVAYETAIGGSAL